jgi:hypothetical protein
MSFKKSSAIKDTKVAGALVGAGSLGLVGFTLFSSTVFFGIGGGILGMGLGAMIGSKMKRKTNLNKFTADQLISFRVSCIIEWTKKNQNSLNELWHAILIERIILDAKMLLEYAHKKRVKACLVMVRKFILD